MEIGIHPRFPIDARRRRCRLGANVVPQIAPARIGCPDQANLPQALPLLGLLFARDRCIHGGVNLGPHEQMRSMAPGKSRHQIISMLPDARRQVRGDSDVQRAVRTVARDVHGGLSRHAASMTNDGQRRGRHCSTPVEFRMDPGLRRDDAIRHSDASAFPGEGWGRNLSSHHFAAAGNAGSLPMSRASCWMITVALRFLAMVLKRSNDASVSCRLVLNVGTPFVS